MNRSKILWAAAATTFVGVFACSFAIRCLKLAKPANHAQVAALAKPPKVAGKSRESDEAAGKEVSVVTESDTFARSVKHSVPTLLIQSSINGGPWVKSTAIYPLKGQKVALKVEKISGGKIRWYQIIPDTSKIYKNANLPWEKDAYKWVGLAKIDYQRKELTGCGMGFQPMETRPGWPCPSPSLFVSERRQLRRPYCHSTALNAQSG